MIYVLYYLFNSFSFGEKPPLFNEKNPDQLKLPKWVNVSKEKFNDILCIITKGKNFGLKTNVDGKEITLDNAESFLKIIVSGKINGIDLKKEYNNIVDYVKKILKKLRITRSHKKLLMLYYFYAKSQSHMIKNRHYITICCTKRTISKRAKNRNTRSNS